MLYLLIEIILSYNTLHKIKYKKEEIMRFDFKFIISFLYHSICRLTGEKLPHLQPQATYLVLFKYFIIE